MSTARHPNKQVVYALASMTGLILLLVWMQGGFVSKTPPGNMDVAEGGQAAVGTTVKVVREEVDDILSWPGSVTARVTAQLAPKVAARVSSILVHAGDQVVAGQILARLDERELQARLGQARSALSAAEAEAARAGADARRVRNLFDKEAATRQSLEAAQAATRTAQAQVAEARAGIAAAQSLAAETVLRAPFAGSVVQRLLEPGDMAMPGSPLLILQSEQRPRIEATVPQACAASIAVGQVITARIAADSLPVRVEEVAPAADPNTRTVLVKAAVDAAIGVPPGTFAWLEQACGRRAVLRIPDAAVTRRGQLESVQVLVDGRPRLRHVRSGKRHDGLVEVLAGLKEGDIVWLGDGR